MLVFGHASNFFLYVVPKDHNLHLITWLRCAERQKRTQTGRWNLIWLQLGSQIQSLVCLGEGSK